MNTAQPQYPEFTKHRSIRETAGAARRHLVTPSQEVNNALIDVVISRPIRRQSSPVTEVARPAPQQGVQSIPHHRPGTDIAGVQDGSHLLLQTGEALPGWTRTQIPVAVLTKAMRPKGIAQKVKMLLSGPSDAGLSLVQGQTQTGHYLSGPGQGFPGSVTTQDDKVIRIGDHTGFQLFSHPAQPPVFQEAVQVQVGQQRTDYPTLGSAALAPLATCQAPPPLIIHLPVSYTHL